MHVSSDIQTPRSPKKNSAVPRFFNLLLSVWISDETLLLVLDILLKCTNRHLLWFGGSLIINANANKNNGCEHTVEPRLHDTLRQVSFHSQRLAHAVIFFTDYLVGGLPCIINNHKPILIEAAFALA